MNHKKPIADALQVLASTVDSYPDGKGKDKVRREIIALSQAIRKGTDEWAVYSAIQRVDTEIENIESRLSRIESALNRIESALRIEDDSEGER